MTDDDAEDEEDEEDEDEDEDEDEERYWSAVEALAEETVRGYRGLMPDEVLEEMRVALVMTLGAHPNVEPVMRELVRRQRIREAETELDERERF